MVGFIACIVHVISLHSNLDFIVFYIYVRYEDFEILPYLVPDSICIMSNGPLQGLERLKNELQCNRPDFEILPYYTTDSICIT